MAIVAQGEADRPLNRRKDRLKVIEPMNNEDLLTTLLRTRNRYLNTLELALTGMLFQDGTDDTWSVDKNYNESTREIGGDWPKLAHTMTGLVRMRCLRQICESVIMNEVEGDFIETGVWRGGSCIYMKAILEAYGDRSRRVFLADSFQGLPPPDPETYVHDSGSVFYLATQLAVSRQDVEANFRRYGLLDSRVVFLEGWFKDTLPVAPIEKLAVLRLDGDMYESTIQALDALYHKVSPGGAIIVDDFGIPECAAAIHDFRGKYGITSYMRPIDTASVWWPCDHPPIKR